jgi:O-antigen/teichoic acid export membrane protein
MAHGIAWNVAGGVLMQAGTFLTSLVVARILGRQAFGRFALVQSTMVALTALAGLGLGVTATKYLSQYRGTDPERAGRILGLSSAIAATAAFCLCLAIGVFAPLLHGHIAAADLRISTVYIFFMTLNGYQAGALAGLEAFRRIVRIGLWCAPVSVALHAILAWGLGIQGALLAQGISAAFLWLSYHLALVAEGRRFGIAVRYRDAWRERAAMLQFSIPATLSGITGSIAIWWCNNALVKSSDYAALGMFAAASTLRMVVLFVPSMITRVTSPLLNSLRANGDIAGYKRIFWGAIACNGGIAAALAVFLSLAGRHIPRLFGKEFVAPPLLMAVLLASGFVEAVATSLYQALFTRPTLWWQVGACVLWSGVLVAISNLAIPVYGASGLAFAYLIAWCASGILYAAVAQSGREQNSHADTKEAAA